MPNFEKPQEVTFDGRGMWETPPIGNFSTEESDRIYSGKADAIFDRIKEKAAAITDTRERDAYTGDIIADCGTASHKIISAFEAFEEMDRDYGDKKNQPTIKRLKEQMDALSQFEKQITSLVVGE